MRGPRGTFLARLPTIVCPPTAQKNAKIRIHFEVLSDANDNLAEYWGEKNGDALLVDSDQISASLRILKRNEIIKSTMAPSVTCPAGEETNLEVDGFRIAAKPHVTTDGGVLLMTKIVPGPEREGVDANAVLRKGDTLIVRARQKENATFALPEVDGYKGWTAVEASDAVYVVLVAELQR